MIVIIGTSYAVFNFSFLGEKSSLSVIHLELKLLESNQNVVDIKNAFPVPDSVGKEKEDTFDFAIITKADYNTEIGYSIKIEKLEIDTGYTELKDNEIKVYLTDYNNNSLVNPTKISSLSNYILYGKTNTHSNTITEIKDKYKLRVWIDENVDARGWTEDTKLEYKFKIGVTEKAKPASETIIKKVGTSGLETVRFGATEDLTEYRYRGGDDVVTNNYIYFNCSDINNQTADTCELYRIIGVFPTEDGEGNIENRIKIIKAENYGNNYWNTGGTNNWAEASLNTTFNETYYNSINEAYQNLIGDTKYYLGGYVSIDIYTEIMYRYERKISGSDYYYGNNPNSWTGKIGLMYASDYGYGANSACSTSTTLNNYKTNSCLDNNWLYLGSTEWLLPQRSSYSNLAFRVYSSGYVSYGSVSFFSSAVRPVLYLNANATFNNQGDGSSTNPYQLS